MNKFLAIALLAIFFAQFACAETVFERSFKEMGYGGFSLDGPLVEGCTEVTFIFPEGKAEIKENYSIASIAAEFSPVNEKKADLNVFLNNSKIAELTQNDFKCSKSLCWERLFLPKGLLKEEKNSLRICMKTGHSIIRMKLSDESKIGLYKTADFSGKSDFRMIAEKTELVIGEKTEISIILHNGGSDLTAAEIKFARPLAEDKNAFSVVEGDTYFREGTIKAGETIKIIYVVKPRVAATMTLPPAIVYYKNEFLEQESKFSNLVTLNVREPERKVEAFIVKTSESALVGQPVEMALAVKNVGRDPVYDLSIDMQSNADLAQDSSEIGTLLPKETKYIPFTAMSGMAGKFPIGCTIVYNDTNSVESKCLDSFVEFLPQEISPAIYGGIVLIAVALIAYAYIMHGK